MLKQWLSSKIQVAFRSTYAVSSWVSSWIFDKMESSGVISPSFLRKTLLATLSCILALGGAIVGTVAGAMKGQTTETGFLRGAGIGAVSGAITAIQLMESMAAGESLSKVALFGSLMNGKVFVEWVVPAMLKAYQWQMNSLQTAYGEISDIFDVNGTRGLPRTCFLDLPIEEYHCTKTAESGDEIYCSICLQELKDGELTRKLPKCRHMFHVECVDQWLVRQESCPVCRELVCTDFKDK